MTQVLIIGASGGIGFAMTRLLLEQGKRVIATVRSDDTKNSARLKTLHDKYNEQIVYVTMDVTRQISIENAFTEIQNFTDLLHLIINCTGLLHHGNALQPEKRLEDVNADNLAESFSVNATAPLLIARYALPLLRHKQRSVLSNISARVGSISDNRMGGWYAYRAAKAAQNMITKTIAIELSRRSPNTICVGLHPGTVDTALSQPFQKNLKPGQLTTPEQSVQYLYDVISGLKHNDSGKVFAWDDSEILP